MDNIERINELNKSQLILLVEFLLDKTTVCADELLTEFFNELFFNKLDADL